MAVRGAEGGPGVLSAVLTPSRALALSVGLKRPLEPWLCVGLGSDQPPVFPLQWSSECGVLFIE